MDTHETITRTDGVVDIGDRQYMTDARGALVPLSTIKAQDKLIEVGIEIASLLLVLLMVLRLVAVQMLVGIAQGDVERQLLFLESAYVSGVEHRTIGREVFQIAHVP